MRAYPGALDHKRALSALMVQSPAVAAAEPTRYAPDAGYAQRSPAATPTDASHLYSYVGRRRADRRTPDAPAAAAERRMARASRTGEAAGVA